MIPKFFTAFTNLGAAQPLSPKFQTLETALTCKPRATRHDKNMRPAVGFAIAFAFVVACLAIGRGLWLLGDWWLG